MGNRGEKRISCGLSCFRGSSSLIDDEESDGRSLEGQRRRPKSSVSWSRFRAKKKTTPLPVLDASVPENAVDGPTAAADDEADMILPAKASNAKKKGFLKRFHKDKTISHGSPTQLNKQKQKQPLEGPHTSPIRHVTSMCKARAQPATPLVQQPDRTNHMQVRTGKSQTGSAKQSNNPSTSKNTMRKRGNNEKNSEAGLIVLAVTLTSMLLGGRAVAILCMSAWFYISPSMSTIAVKCKMKWTRDMRSEQYKEKVVLQGLPLERRNWMT